MSKYCLFLIVIYYLTGGNNSMSRFFKFGKLQVFVSFDVAHYTSKLLTFSQITQNAPRTDASPYASTKTCTFATAPSCEREACS